MSTISAILAVIGVAAIVGALAGVALGLWAVHSDENAERFSRVLDRAATWVARHRPD